MQVDEFGPSVQQLRAEHSVSRSQTISPSKRQRQFQDDLNEARRHGSPNREIETPLSSEVVETSPGTFEEIDPIDAMEQDLPWMPQGDINRFNYLQEDHSEHNYGNDDYDETPQWMPTDIYAEEDAEELFSPPEQFVARPEEIRIASSEEEVSQVDDEDDTEETATLSQSRRRRGNQPEFNQKLKPKDDDSDGEPNNRGKKKGRGKRGKARKD